LLVLPACGRLAREHPELADAGDAPSALHVVVNDAGVALEKDHVAPPPGDAIAQIPALGERLAARRARWVSALGDRALPDPLEVEIDLAAGVSCRAAYSVIMEATVAGFHALKLRSGATSLELRSVLPPSPWAEQSPRAPFLALAFHPDGSVDLKPTACMAPFDTVPLASAAPAARAWCDFNKRPDCVEWTHLICDEGVPFDGVLAALAAVRRGSPRMVLEGRGADCQAEPGALSWDHAFAAATHLGRLGASWVPPPPPAAPAHGRAPVVHVRPGAVTRGGAPATEDTLAAVRARIGDVEACYRAALAGNPDLQGTVEVWLELGRTGGAMAVRERRVDLPDGPVVRCLMGAMSRATFPASSEPTRLVVPFTLTRTK
jgi:hypothetical protein